MDFPLWVSVLISVLCLISSGLMAGLTLALMSLSVSELNLLATSSPSPQRAKAAKKILPLRRRGNLLLCSLLFANMAINSVMSIFMTTYLSGPVAVVASTFSLLIFSEILPQALFSRHALVVGSALSPLVYAVLLISLPICGPLAGLLTMVIGEEEEVREEYSKAELHALLELRGCLSAEEQAYVGGALDFCDRCVADIMTPMEDVYTLSDDRIVDAKTVAEIHASGYSRIPVRSSEHPAQIVGFLLARDLLMLDVGREEHHLTCGALLDVYQHELLKVSPDVRLDRLLTTFKSGRAHLAIVSRTPHAVPSVQGRRLSSSMGSVPVNLGSVDIGIVTLEDVFEELIQDEIVDESDIFIDVHKKKPVARSTNSRSASTLPALVPPVEARASTRLPTAAEVETIVETISRNVPAVATTLTAGVLRRVVEHTGLRIVPPFSYIVARGKCTRSLSIIVSGVAHAVDCEEDHEPLVGPVALSSDGLTSAQGWTPGHGVQCGNSPLVLFRLSSRAFHAAVAASKLEGQGLARDAPAVAAALERTFTSTASRRTDGDDDVVAPHQPSAPRGARPRTGLVVRHTRQGSYAVLARTQRHVDLLSPDDTLLVRNAQAGSLRAASVLRARADRGWKGASLSTLSRGRDLDDDDDNDDEDVGTYGTGGSNDAAFARGPSFLSHSVSGEGRMGATERSALLQHREP